MSHPLLGRGRFEEQPRSGRSFDNATHERERHESFAARRRRGGDVSMSADRRRIASHPDQMAADSDQAASERDQLASERDQEAADRDQALNDRTDGGGASREGYARSRRARSQGAIERDQASEARSQTAAIRDEAAVRRDRIADERDGDARARDQLAGNYDDQIERLELASGREDGGPPSDSFQRAAGDRQRAAARRDQAAVERDAAAGDRDWAAKHRRQAALDRGAAAEALASEGIDHVTEVLRRRTGLGAIQREMDRTRGTDERVVVAFVDVDGLQTINDAHGDAAGDELLRAVARLITHHLRSYDVIARFGASEFVCSLSGQDAAWVRERFERISDQLADTANGATFALGLAERRTDDSVDDVIRRAELEARTASAG
jgi:diguanylate cyclase (GGDEF)-like protein